MKAVRMTDPKTRAITSIEDAQLALDRALSDLDTIPSFESDHRGLRRTRLEQLCEHHHGRGRAPAGGSLPAIQIRRSRTGSMGFSTRLT